MQVNVSRVSPVVVELQIQLPEETVKAEINRAYSALSKRAHIKGFRPGKAPRSVLEKLFAPQVANDVTNTLVQNSLNQAIAAENVTPINQPNVQPESLPQVGNAFSYKARFEVQPELGEVKYEGFEVERPSSEVEDKTVDEEIESLRARNAQLKAPEPARPAKTGDVATIDFVLTVEGEEVKDGGGSGVQLELGTGQALPEIDAVLMGAEVGAKVECKTTFPEGHPRTDFRGKEGTFAITLTDLKEKVLPELDDEFAKDLGASFTTLVELRVDIFEKLKKAMKDRADQAVAEQLVLKLNDANPCEVPPSLVEAQARMMEQELAQQARRMGQRFTQEQANILATQVRADAERKVRAGLVMASIARAQEFKVTEEDLENGIKELAEESGKNIAKVRAEYREKSKRDVLVGMVLEDKILTYLEGKAKVTDLPAGEWPKLLKRGSTEEKAEGETAEAAEGEKAEAKAEGDKPAKAKKAKGEKAEKAGSSEDK